MSAFAQMAQARGGAGRVCRPSASASVAGIMLRRREPPLRADFVAKSKVARPRIFRENTKRKVITDSYGLNRFAEVACEFSVRR